MEKPKIARNRKLVRLRKKNPKKWTFRALGERFRIDFKTAFDIFRRDENKY